MDFRRNKYTFIFQQFKTIKSFSDSIFNVKITLREANGKQGNLLENILEFNNGADKQRKKILLKKINANSRIMNQNINS